MNLSGLLDSLNRHPVYQDLLKRLRGTEKAIDYDIIRAARPFLIAALAREWDGPVLIVTAHIKRAYNIAEQLPVWLGDSIHIERLAEPTPLFYDRVPWDVGVIRNRIETLAVLVEGRQTIIVTSARAAMQRTMPPALFRQHTIHLATNVTIKREQLLSQLVQIGYEPSTLVTQPGTFSRRGSIIDIFPLTAPHPIRLDFFDDIIETIKYFDPSTQRSTSAIDHIVVPPAREVPPLYGKDIAEQLALWSTTLRQRYNETTGPLDDVDLLAQAVSFPYLEHYLPYCYPPASLFNYAPPHALIILEEPDELEDVMRDIDDKARKNRDAHIRNELIAPDHPQPYLDWDQFVRSLAGRQRLDLGHYPDADKSTARLFALGGRWGGQLRAFLTHVRELKTQGRSALVVTEQAARLTNLWHEQDASVYIPVQQNLTDIPTKGTVTFINGVLNEGWSLANSIDLFTDAEIFGWSRPEPRRRKGIQRSKRTIDANYADWREGDFVVHVDFGIGKFLGLRHRILEGTEREYLVVEYAGTDTLFVPIHQADRLTRYVGADDNPPALNRLGKPTEWLRIRDKAQKNAEEEARQLLEIYARRAATIGYHYSADTPWQNELEASFPFVETEDQLRALRDVKMDMERDMPMDRLICGDVGYGKTEVALRAAFKAVMDGKQVAVLAPTTVLAQQHYETFSSRLAPFPVRVEVLSRWRTKAEQVSLLSMLANGEVDVLVGTHRLLSGDVKWKDLGLVIIDEEQRFGVKDKEHFKALRAQVDILTLTATPIPRTLYMSLSGIRDISMIQTPPEERLPVITIVGKFDERQVRQAILREIERGGQVFIVHNRVRTIETVRERIEQIVPEARVVVGHGQMTPRQLEAVMAQFSRGEADVLLATAIIENGIDIPNANTLIVDRAELFGMAQLYQLRGRVGRSAQQAYAYFFYDGRLTDEARLRLEALAEHSDLGAGFQLAMRDLELRGAGDILSTRQTGHVAAIGLHLYTQLLTQAVRQFKGQTTAEAIPAIARDKIVIDLPLAAYLPGDWIPEMTLRLQIYRRIGALQNEAEIIALREELYDRFGPLPKAVEGLLYQMEVKLLAQSIRATAIVKPREQILIKLPYLVALDREALASALGDDVAVSRTAVELNVNDELWQLRLLDVLRQLRDYAAEAVGA